MCEKRSYQAPVLNGNVLGLVICITGGNGGRDRLPIQTFSSRVGNGQESRSKIRVASDSIQSLVLGNSRASNNKRDVDISFFEPN